MLRADRFLRWEEVFVVNTRVWLLKDHLRKVEKKKKKKIINHINV